MPSRSLSAFDSNGRPKYLAAITRWRVAVHSSHGARTRSCIRSSRRRRGHRLPGSSPAPLSRPGTAAMASWWCSLGVTAVHTVTMHSPCTTARSLSVGSPGTSSSTCRSPCRRERAGRRSRRRLRAHKCLRTLLARPRPRSWRTRCASPHRGPLRTCWPRAFSRDEDLAQSRRICRGAPWRASRFWLPSSASSARRTW